MTYDICDESDRIWIKQLSICHTSIRRRIHLHGNRHDKIPFEKGVLPNSNTNQWHYAYIGRLKSKHFSSHWPLTFRSIGPERKVKIICNYNPISSSLLRRFCCHTIFNHQFTYRLTVLSRKWVLQETPFYNIRTPTRPRIEFTFINNVYFKLLTPIDLIRWNRKTV